MAIGIKTYTPDGKEQLNSAIPNMRVVATGIAPTAIAIGRISIPDLYPESPMLLIKPAPGVFVGGVQCFQRNSLIGNCFQYQSNGSFQWALCSTVGNPVSIGDGKVGLKMWDVNGQLIFTPQFKYPRIQSLVSIQSPPYSQSATSRSVSFQPLANVPWIIAQDATMVFEVSGGGDMGFPPFCYSLAIGGALNSLTVQMRNTDDFSPSGYQAANDVFNGKLMRFPLCDIPGL